MLQEDGALGAVARVSSTAADWVPVTELEQSIVNALRRSGSLTVSELSSKLEVDISISALQQALVPIIRSGYVVEDRSGRDVEVSLS